jgi:hypothetical protein
LRQGGAIYYNFIIPILKGITNVNNTALYGPNIASYGVKIRLNSNPDEDMKIDNCGPGVVVEDQLRFALLDYHNQIMTLNNEQKVTISPVDSRISSVSGTFSELMENGTAKFDNLKAIAKPESKNVMFRASSKAIDAQKINEIFGRDYFTNLIKINFRN